MTDRKAKFTQADIVRAIRAIQKTGEKMEIRIEPDGTIRILPFAEDQPLSKWRKRANRPPLSM